MFWIGFVIGMFAGSCALAAIACVIASSDEEDNNETR
jgi:hypothetical protein|nr:MAG TPA: Protein of unknown function (DUF3789) [Caudoviricetes sp.]